MELKFRVAARIAKPVHEVFEAVADPASLSHYFTTVTMTFKPLDDGRTLVEIAEEGWRENQGALQASYGNCMGWSQMLCALKVWLEHGINLREGMYK